MRVSSAVNHRGLPSDESNIALAETGICLGTGLEVLVVAVPDIAQEALRS